MTDAHALTQIIILLLAGVMAISIMRRIGLSPIVGYLVVGILIGPNGSALIEESETTHLLAELGVVFLLFDIGLHFTLSSIWEARRDIFGLGPLQIVLCGLAFAGIAITLGVVTGVAIVLGVSLALSSTAVVVPTLSERRQRNCPVGLTGTAVLIFQDICAIFLIILAASLDSTGSTPGQTGLATTVALALAKAVGMFLAAILIGRYAIQPMFRWLSQTQNEEIFTASALLVVLATAAATGGAGLSLTLGAFLGGMIISETPYRHVIQTEAKPFRHLLLGFFFITVGMSLDWRILMALWVEILGFVLALVLLKGILIAAAARAVGWTMPGSVQLGFLLAQGSEFVFVIIAMPMVRETLGEHTVSVLFTGVAASLALTPTIATLGNRLARLLDQELVSAKRAAEEATPRSATAPVILFGMNEVGRTVADSLEANGVAYEAIEGNYDRFISARADGYSVGFADFYDVRLMDTLAYSDRKIVIIAITSHSAAEKMAPIMHERYPELTCFIAVEKKEEIARYEILGLRPVVDRSLPRGLDLAATVLRYHGIDEAKIETWMRRQQERAFRPTVISPREADFVTPS